MGEIEPYKEEKQIEARDWSGDPKQMGFLDHLEELRWTLIKPLAVFAVVFILVMVRVKFVSNMLMWPLHQALNASNATGAQGFEALATRNPMGVYTAMLQIGFIVAMACAFPVLLYNGSKFVAPALTKKEKGLLLPGSIAVFVLFFIGSSFSFFVLLPKTIQITIWFNGMLGWELIWTPDSYFNFMIWIVLGMGMSFQFPLAVLVLVYLGIISVDKLKKSRRIMIVVFLIVAAFLTPPDPFTQVMVAGPMILLYELSIIVGRMIERKRREEAEVI